MVANEIPIALRVNRIWAVTSSRWGERSFFLRESSFSRWRFSSRGFFYRKSPFERLSESRKESVKLVHGELELFIYVETISREFLFFFSEKKRGFHRNDIVLSFCSISLCEVAADNAEKFHMKKLELRTFTDARNIHLINNEISVFIVRAWPGFPSWFWNGMSCQNIDISLATRHGCFCAPILQERI